MAPTVSFIGIGNMGRGMAGNLATKGPLAKPLRLYNRTLDRARDLASSLPLDCAVAVSTLKEAIVGVDLIFICLSTDDAVAELLDSILALGAIDGKVLVNCSTVTPETSTKVAKAIESQKADYVACPVFGPATVAAAGQLLVACAGPASAVSRVSSLLTGVTARYVLDMSGEAPSKAALLKSISNTVVVNMIEATAEALVLADKTGLGATHMQRLAKELWPGPCAFYAERMAGNTYADGKPLSSAKSGLDQLKRVMDLADSTGTKIPATETAVKHLNRVTDTMGSQGDVAGIYGAVREESGLVFGPSAEHNE